MYIAQYLRNTNVQIPIIVVFSDTYSHQRTESEHLCTPLCIISQTKNMNNNNINKHFMLQNKYNQYFSFIFGIKVI